MKPTCHTAALAMLSMICAALAPAQVAPVNGHVDPGVALRHIAPMDRILPPTPPMQSVVCTVQTLVETILRVVGSAGDVAPTVFRVDGVTATAEGWQALLDAVAALPTGVVRDARMQLQIDGIRVPLQDLLTLRGALAVATRLDAGTDEIRAACEALAHLSAEARAVSDKVAVRFDRVSFTLSELLRLKDALARIAQIDTARVDVLRVVEALQSVPAQAARCTGVEVVVGGARIPLASLLAFSRVYQKIAKINGSAVEVAYAYVFSWGAEKREMFPELIKRTASYDSYLGWRERQIAEACRDGDYDAAEKMAAQYLKEWDNYAAQKQIQKFRNRQTK